MTAEAVTAAGSASRDLIAAVAMMKCAAARVNGEGGLARHSVGVSVSSALECDADSVALQVAIALGNVRLIGAIDDLTASFRIKGWELTFTPRARTAFDGAAPMAVGQTFSAFAESLTRETRALESAQHVLCAIDISDAGCEHLAAVSGLRVYVTRARGGATPQREAFLAYSSCLKHLAVTLSQVCSDLRALQSGARRAGNDADLAPKPRRPAAGGISIGPAAEHPQQEVPESIVAACVFDIQTLFIDAAHTLRTRCVELVA